MKKAFLSLVTVLYMLSSSGMAWEVHYCMGERVGFDFFHGKDEKCRKCGMAERKGCCSDDQQFFKLSIDQKTVNTVSCPDIPFKFFSPLQWQGLSETPCSPAERPSFNLYSPPRPSGIGLCIRNCVFRI